MLIVPTQPVANQTLNVSLANQACTINIYAKGQFDYAGLYLDLYVNNALIIGGVICLNAVKIVRSSYLGFVGDLAFFDNQVSTVVGAQDGDNPLYTGLGSRWFLYYLTAAEASDP